MSVELIDSDRFYGYRVRRQIDGQTYQEYFSLKENGKRLRGARRQVVKTAAVVRDNVLANRQIRAERLKLFDRMFDKKGNVRGILMRMKQEKSGTLTPTLQLGFSSLISPYICATTISINAHGLANAWEKAVNLYVIHKEIAQWGAIHDRLLKACPSDYRLKKLVRTSRS